MPTPRSVLKSAIERPDVSQHFRFVHPPDISALPRLRSGFLILQVGTPRVSARQPATRERASQVAAAPELEAAPAPLHEGSVLLGGVDAGEVRLAVRAQNGVAVL